MNITEEIIKKLELIGCSYKLNTIVKYFISQNINDIFAKNLMDVADFDFTLVNNSIDLDCIFSMGRYVISVQYDESLNAVKIICDRIVNNDSQDKDETTRVFQITETSSTIENKFIGFDGVQKKFTFDKSEMRFDLEVSHMDNDKEVIDYKGSLSPMFAKNRNYDWFTYDRKIPPKENGKSILKRMVDELSGKGYCRQVMTSSDANIDLTEFPDSIYESLINDARIVLASTKTENRQMIRI